MMQYYTHLLQISLVRKTRKAIVETISKQLEYVTKGHTNNVVLNLKQLYSLVLFSLAP